MRNDKTIAVELALECWADHKSTLSVKDAAMVHILAEAAQSWLDGHTAQYNPDTSNNAAKARSEALYGGALRPETTFEEMTARIDKGKQ